jgi:hypothetical protein
MLLCAAALAGCASAEQIAAADDAKCIGYGFTKGTDSFARCRLALDTSRQEMAVAHKRATKCST